MNPITTFPPCFMFLQMRDVKQTKSKKERLFIIKHFIIIYNNLHNDIVYSSIDKLVYKDRTETVPIPSFKMLSFQNLGLF